MACTCAFKSEIPVDCIREVSADAVGKNVSLATAKKALWACGCLVETWDPEAPPPNVPVFGSTGTPCADAEECGRKMLDIVGPTGVCKAKLDPQTTALLFSLLQQLFQFWLTKG